MPEVRNQEDEQEHPPHFRIVGCAQDQRLAQRESQVHISQAAHCDERSCGECEDPNEATRRRELQVCLWEEKSIVCADEGRDRLDVEEEELVRQGWDLECHGCGR